MNRRVDDEDKVDVAALKPPSHKLQSTGISGQKGKGGHTGAHPLN